VTETPAALLDVARRVGMAAADNVAVLRPSGRVQVAETKSSATDAVTLIDRASEDFIRARLLAERPDDSIVGEEGDDHIGAGEVAWLVDPIDGTVNFVYGIPAYAISIAAAIADEVVAGYVINVVSGESWGASRGGGAWFWPEPDAEGARLSTDWATNAELAQALVATGFNYLPEVRARQATAIASMITEVRDIRRFGAASLDLCAVAMGRVDAYVEQGLQLWDLAAGVLIAREAGLVAAGPQGEGEPSERLVMVAPGTLAKEFFDLVVACGF
jgi:myo-inositol-1(or 4)-monophosphatase